MLKVTLLCATLAVAQAHPQSPFGFSFGGRPSGGSPFGGGSSSSFGSGSSSPFGPSSSSPFGGPSSSSPFGGPSSSSPFGGPSSSSPFGPSSSSSFGPSSSSPFSGGSSSPFSSGPPSYIQNIGPPRGNAPGRPSGFPSKPPRGSSSKLFNWLGNTMSKIPGLVPKIHYHNPSKSKPSSSSSYSGSSSPPSGHPQIPNSVFEDGPPSSSPYRPVSVSFGPSSGSPQHGSVSYRSPGPPPGFGGRPRGPPPQSFSSSRPSFSPRPQFSSNRPSYSSGGPDLNSYSRPIGSSSPYSSSGPSFGGPPPASSPYTHDIRNNLEVFPSQQISYQTQTLNQNDAGYNDIQNLYGSQSKNKPSYSGTSHFTQQTSYSQPQPQAAASNTGSGNYGATFHQIEPVSVAPIYDVGHNFKPSAADLSGSASQTESQQQQQQQQQQQSGNIHDTPFVTLVNDYAAQADADTSGSEKMISALQSSADMLTAASSNIGLPEGMRILGQSTSPEGNPVFDVVADSNAPTYDGHPVDLNRLISMIEPGAQIDTVPNFGDVEQQGSASEQQPMFADAPTNLDLESDAMMSMSGKEKRVSGNKSQAQNSNNFKITHNLHSLASESKPTVVKLDGTRLDDEELIKEHFDKEIILDDLQDNKDSGLIIIRMGPDNETGDETDNFDLFRALQENRSVSITSNIKDKDILTDDNLLAIIQQLRNSAIVNTLEKPSSILQVTQTETHHTNNSTNSSSHHHPHHNRYPNTEETTTLHPNHNYKPFYLHSSNSTSTPSKEDNNNDTVVDLPTPPPPKINPIFDSVRPSRIRFSKSSSSSVSISVPSDDDDEEQTTVAGVTGDDNDDDDSHMLPADTFDYPDNDTGDSVIDDDVDDDMTIESAGDLAASASRNVKSVAIIVTPPPHYVKIRNKYKKANIPMSALTSSTTPESPSSEILESSSNSNEADLNSESNSNNNYNNPNDSNENISENPRSSIPSPTAATTAISSSKRSDDGAGNGVHETDSFLQSILRGLQISQSSSNTSNIDSSSNTNNNNDGKEEVNNTENKKPRRYPVYRGKSS